MSYIHRKPVLLFPWPHFHSAPKSIDNHTQSVARRSKVAMSFLVHCIEQTSTKQTHTRHFWKYSCPMYWTIFFVFFLFTTRNYRQTFLHVRKLYQRPANPCRSQGPQMSAATLDKQWQFSVSTHFRPFHVQLRGVKSGWKSQMDRKSQRKNSQYGRRVGMKWWEERDKELIYFSFFFFSK